MNALMERRHSADYKSFVPIEATDVAEFKPWVGGFLRDTLKLLGASAPRREATALGELLRNSTGFEFGVRCAIIVRRSRAAI